MNKLISVLSLFLLLNTQTYTETILHTRTCPVQGVSDTVAKFVYKHPFLCFFGMCLYTEDCFKSLIGTLIAGALAREYLSTYGHSHGICLRHKCNHLTNSGQDEFASSTNSNCSL